MDEKERVEAAPTKYPSLDVRRGWVSFSVKPDPPYKKNGTMENEAPDRRKKAYSIRRAILDYGMGIIIFGIGVFLLIAPRLHVALNIDDLNRYMFAGLCLLYGGFRAYRGAKKNYYK